MHAVSPYFYDIIIDIPIKLEIDNIAVFKCLTNNLFDVRFIDRIKKIECLEVNRNKMSELSVNTSIKTA